MNEYHWGDFKGNPNRLMERYYDTHLYVANWGTHRAMFRLPCDLLDPDVVEDYCVGDQVSAWVADEFVVLDFTSEDHAGEFDFDYDAEALLSAIVGVRAELASGDLRPLYLAWLAAYGAWERDEDVFDRDADDDLEPLVPHGLDALTAAQRALADFLRLDDDLLAIAAQTSTPQEEVAADPGDLTAWVVARLPVAEKDRLLARVVHGGAARVPLELLRRFRGDTAPTTPVPGTSEFAAINAKTSTRGGWRGCSSHYGLAALHHANVMTSSEATDSGTIRRRREPSPELSALIGEARDGLEGLRRRATLRE